MTRKAETGAQAAATAGHDAAVKKAVAVYEAEAKASFAAAKKALAEASGKPEAEVAPPIAAEPEAACKKANAVINHLHDSTRAVPPEPADLQIDGDHDDAPWPVVIGELKSRCTAAYSADDAKVVVVVGHPGKTPLELAIEGGEAVDQNLRGAISGSHPNSPKARKLRTDLLDNQPQPIGKAGWMTYFEHAIGVIEARQEKAAQGTLPEEDKLPQAIVRQLPDLREAYDAIAKAPAQQGRAAKSDQTDWSPKVKLAVLSLDAALDAFTTWIHGVKALPKARKDQLKADVFGRRPGDTKTHGATGGKQEGGDKTSDSTPGAGGTPPAKS